MMSVTIASARARAIDESRECGGDVRHSAPARRMTSSLAMWIRYPTAVSTTRAAQSAILQFGRSPVQRHSWPIGPVKYLSWSDGYVRRWFSRYVASRL